MHNSIIIVSMLVATLRAATPLMLAGFGELVAERSGVLNLGVEGMMLVGAATGFLVTAATGAPALGLVAAIVAGAVMAAGFALLSLYLMANQVATGLALTIFGVGLSALIGAPFQSISVPGLARTLWPWMSRAHPIVQQLLLIDPLVWLALLTPFAISLFMRRSRYGLVLRAVGESAEVAHALGYPVRRVRLLAVLFGGAMAGLGGAYLSLAYTPMWSDDMVAGRGWIALALVVFSTWKPLWLALGALLFGFVTIAQYQAQALGLPVNPQLLAMLPYLVTVLVLVLISRDRVRLKLSAPAALGRTFAASA
jgi:simple sugar transport system permease protein